LPFAEISKNGEIEIPNDMNHFSSADNQEICVNTTCTLWGSKRCTACHQVVYCGRVNGRLIKNIVKLSLPLPPRFGRSWIMRGNAIERRLSSSIMDSILLLFKRRIKKKETITSCHSFQSFCYEESWKCAKYITYSAATQIVVFYRGILNYRRIFVDCRVICYAVATGVIESARVQAEAE
jgi:hypothetical protein